MMGNRTLGDEIEDQWLGEQGIHTGGLLNQQGLESRRRAQQCQNTDIIVDDERNTSDGPKSFEKFISGFIAIALWSGISFYGIAELKLDWYWPVGFGFVAAVTANKLLMGPLFFVLTGVKWLLYLGGLIGLLYLFVGN